MNAIGLNNMYATFRRLEMGPEFKARFVGKDAVTDRPLYMGDRVRYLDGQLLGALSGVTLFSLCERVNGTFVDDVEGDGRYWVINQQGGDAARRYTVADGRVFDGADPFGKGRSLAAFRAQKLVHAVAVVKELRP